jgi:hypothetical protein
MPVRAELATTADVGHRVCAAPLQP